VRTRRHARAIVAALTLVLSIAPLDGQNVTESSLKAAFIYNFAKFTEWPQDVLPATASFVACVLGDAAVGAALERATRGRLLSGRTISVAQVRVEGPLQTCHLLYVSGVGTAAAVHVLTVVQSMPVLTIGDIDEFTDVGGMAHVFVENGQMRFDLNYESAKHARLQLSSKLLALASHVWDEGHPVKR
jgi:hypothetical protein